MPDLLREQFPHFRPIVEAFGYRNLEFEGWEADDVIATLATRADEAGIKTTVVSTDRDAFQLCSPNIALMMTPRGVADVNVYTPERVELRYGVRPDQVPGLHRPEGRHVGQHPGRPGHRRQDRRAADRAVRLAGGGDRARGRALAGAAEEHHRVRRPGADVEGARDDAARPRHRLRPVPDRARAARSLAAPGDVPPLRVPCAAEPDRGPRGRDPVGRPGAGGRGGRPLAGGRAAAGARPRRDRDRGRPLRARPGGRRHRRRVGREPAAQAAGGSARRARLQGSAPADDGARRRHDDRRLPDRAGPLRVRDRRPPARVRPRGDPGAGHGGGDGRADHACGGGSAPRRSDARAAGRARLRAALRRDRAAAHRRARGDGGRGRQDRHLPDGRDHGPPRRPGRGAGGEGVRARGRGVPDRLDAAGGADPVREAGADAGPQGQDRLLDRHARAPLDPRRARDRRGDRGVARALEARQHLPAPAAAADLGGGRPPAHDLQPDGGLDRPALDHEPEPAGDPDPHRARAGDPLRLRRRAGAPADLGRLQPGRAAHPRARLRRAPPARGVRPQRGHPHGDGRRGARQGSRRS